MLKGIFYGVKDKLAIPIPLTDDDLAEACYSANVEGYVEHFHSEPHARIPYIELQISDMCNYNKYLFITPYHAGVEKILKLYNNDFLDITISKIEIKIITNERILIFENDKKLEIDKRK